VPGATDLLDVPLQDVRDYPLKEQLAFEKELLGIYLSEHPLHAVVARLRGRQVITALGSIDESMAGQRVTVIGMLLEPRPMLTKKGTMMLRATLEGVDAISLDLIAFSEAYERCKDFCVADTVVEVDVRLDQRGEQMQLLAEDMRPCADPEPVVETPIEFRRLHLWVPARDDLDLHGRVQEFLWAFPGSDEIRIHCQRRDGREAVLLSRRRVDVEETLLTSLRSLLGPEAVRVEIASRGSMDDFTAFSAD
jgi:DNA polymerase-3 subunit alpha